MGSTREMKQRIKNIESVEQLIHAMHMVSSTQLRRVNRQLDGAIPVQEALKKKIDEVASLDGVRYLPYYERRKVKNTLYLVLTGDRGLAGAYNAKVQKFALDQMEGKNEKIIVVGSFGNRFFKKNNKNIIKSYVDILDSRIYYGSENIAKLVLDSFISGECDEVFVIYTEFENILSSNPKMTKLLPLPLEDPLPTNKDFEPNLGVYLDNLVPFYLHMTVFRAFSEAHTSEQATRMLSMDTAGTNAKDLVEDLQRKLNRQRQQNITQELAEIIGQK